MNRKRLISLIASVTVAVTSLTSIGSLSAFANNSIDSEMYGSDELYTDTLELYADDADDDPGYEKYYESVYSPDVENNSYTAAAKYSQYSKLWGLDVSKYQGSIDWAQVKSSGIDYTIVRVGFRGYGTGAMVEDPYFDTNMTNASAAGVKLGAYFFSQAINEQEAVEEADYCVERCKAYNLDFPIYIDMEKDDTGRFANANLTTAQRTAIAEAFCNEVEAKGYKGGVYANKSWLNSKLNSSELQENWSIWLAHYVSCTDYTGEYDMWQYTSKGTCGGVSGYVDGNMYFVKPEEDSTEATEAETEEDYHSAAVLNFLSQNENVGDVQEDGAVNSKDAVLVLKYTASLIAGIEPALDDNQARNADVNYDGQVNSVDAVFVLKYSSFSMVNPNISFIDYLVDNAEIRLPEEETESTEATETTEEGTIGAFDDLAESESDN